MFLTNLAHSPEQALGAGIEDSSRLRVRGEGDAGRKGGDMGDLYVFIKVRSHPSLKREGVGIHSTIDVSYVDAILGTNVKVLPLACCKADPSLRTNVEALHVSLPRHRLDQGIRHIA